MSTKVKITPDLYFEEMRKVSQATKPVILKIISSINENYHEIGKEYSYYFNKRIESKKLLLRPFLFKQFLDLLNVNWKDHLEMIALVEIVNISTYQSNLAFDGKDGFKTTQLRNNQVIASIFSKIRIYESLNTLNIYDEKTKSKFSSIITKAFEQLYYGQYLDINELVFENKTLLNNENLYLKTYTNRCTMLGSSLIEMIALLAITISKNENSTVNQLLKDFSILFGKAGQVVNDLGDIAENGKSYTENQFADIENERLTLPLRFAISEVGKLSKDCIKDFFNNTNNIIKTKEYCSNFIKNDVIEINSIFATLTSLGYETEMLEVTSKLLTKSKFIS